MRGFVDDQGNGLSLHPGEMLLSTQYRAKLGLKEGDTVRVGFPKRTDQDFIVGGFSQEPVGLFAYATLEDARRGFGLGLGSTSFYMQVDAGRAAEVRRELNRLPGVATLLDLAEIRAEVDGYLALLYLFVSVMLTFGAFMAFALVFNTSTINILERELEIATMRTLGTPNWKISLALTLENLLMGAFGLLPGFVAAYLVMARTLRLYQTDAFSFRLSIFWSSYVIASIGVLGVMVLSELPSLIYVRRMDLAQSVKRRAT